MAVESEADRLYLLNASDFGVVVSIGGVSTVGQVDYDDDPMLAGGVVGQIGRVRSVLITTASLGSLVIDGAITVDGVAYVARDIQAEKPDGLLTRVWLHN